MGEKRYGIVPGPLGKAHVRVMRFTMEDDSRKIGVEIAGPDGSVAAGILGWTPQELRDLAAMIEDGAKWLEGAAE